MSNHSLTSTPPDGFRLFSVLRAPTHERSQVVNGGISPAVPLRNTFRKTQTVDGQWERTALGEKLRRSAPVRGDHGQTHRHRLHVRAAPTFTSRWENERISCTIQARQLLHRQVDIKQRMPGKRLAGRGELTGKLEHMSLEVGVAVKGLRFHVKDNRVVSGELLEESFEKQIPTLAFLPLEDGEKHEISRLVRQWQRQVFAGVEQIHVDRLRHHHDFLRMDAAIYKLSNSPLGRNPHFVHPVDARHPLRRQTVRFVHSTTDANSRSRRRARLRSSPAEGSVSMPHIGGRVADGHIPL
mmetsp:Transcript_46234/g.122602  ORF Transcript_46234/g.122602 Transcript_46234/m.122602 type:complete len:297 (+) Transcript_46234:97-987(+)